MESYAIAVTFHFESQVLFPSLSIFQKTCTSLTFSDFSNHTTSSSFPIFVLRLKMQDSRTPCLSHTDFTCQTPFSPFLIFPIYYPFVLCQPASRKPFLNTGFFHLQSASTILLSHPFPSIPILSHPFDVPIHPILFHTIDKHLDSPTTLIFPVLKKDPSYI